MEDPVIELSGELEEKPLSYPWPHPVEVASPYDYKQQTLESPVSSSLSTAGPNTKTRVGLRGAFLPWPGRSAPTWCRPRWQVSRVEEAKVSTQSGAAQLFWASPWARELGDLWRHPRWGAGLTASPYILPGTVPWLFPRP